MSFEFKTHNGWLRGTCGGYQFDLMRIVAGLSPPPVQKAEVSPQKYTVHTAPRVAGNIALGLSDGGNVASDGGRSGKFSGNRQMRGLKGFGRNG